MLRVDCYDFCKLGIQLHPLTLLPDDAVLRDHWISIYVAKGELDSFFRTFPLKTCRAPARALYEALVNLIPDDFGFSLDADDGTPRILGYAEVNPIREGAKEMETVLKAELNGWDTFFVSQKGAYSTSDLINRAEIILPESAQAHLTPAALEDIRQAGRSLAFNMGTAASFHIIRASEVFIWKYYEAIIGTLPAVKMRNWGSYSKNLTKSGNADARIIGWMDHIRNEYRNPVLHPEESVTPEGAMEFINACVSLVMSIVRALDRIEEDKQKAVAQTNSAQALSHAFIPPIP